MEELKVIKDDLEAIKEILSQELNISYYSITKDKLIKEAFINAVKKFEEDKSNFKEIIKNICNINDVVRNEGFMSIGSLRSKMNCHLYDLMSEMITGLVNMPKITSILKPSFYYYEADTLIKNVLIHDGLFMCVLGYAHKELETTLNGMLGIIEY